MIFDVSENATVNMKVDDVIRFVLDDDTNECVVKMINKSNDFNKKKKKYVTIKDVSIGGSPKQRTIQFLKTGVYQVGIDGIGFNCVYWTINVSSQTLSQRFKNWIR